MKNIKRSSCVIIVIIVIVIVLLSTIIWPSIRTDRGWNQPCSFSYNCRCIKKGLAQCDYCMNGDCIQSEGKIKCPLEECQ